MHDAFEGMSARQAVEEAAHDMRNHQMNVIGMTLVLQKINTGDLDGQSLLPTLSTHEGLLQIQQSVRAIESCMDSLVQHLRNLETNA